MLKFHSFLLFYQVIGLNLPQLHFKPWGYNEKRVRQDQ